MTNYHELPDIEREILKALLNSDGYTATSSQISEKTYYPDAEVLETVSAMYRRGGLLEPVDRPENTFQHWKPVPAVLDQLLNLRADADAKLSQAIQDAKAALRRYQQKGG